MYRLVRIQSAVVRTATTRRLTPAVAGMFPDVWQFRFMSQAEGMSTEPAPDAEKAQQQQEAAPADPKDAAIQQLKDENTKLKESVKELNATRLRLLAEMENVRTIAKRDVDIAKTYSIQSFAKQLLNVADNLERAVLSVPEDARVKKEGNENFAVLYEGVAATERELLKTLAQFGIEPFGTKGDRFDPNRHEAMLQMPAGPDTAPVHHVAVLLKKGFSFKERTLRPAQVGVAVDQQ